MVTSAIPPSNRGATGDRYVLSAFHARGGMGEVWRCHDATIGRDVALKRLLSDRSAARERFLCEAQITGQLEHPAIVPIHDLGYDDNGRPFYVMKFVHGRTLKSAVDEFHARVDASVSPVAPETAAQASSREPREVMRLRLLSVFVDLCDAVAYAHSRGVIHRDLKPENVMLGAYGETVVLDWGLAKLRGRAELDGATCAESSVASGSINVSGPPTVSTQAAQTEDGSILGSPLYMPPEMAEGHMADADQRTDVYLLGATLYEILTGRPPREGASREEILEMARTAPPVPPRKIVPDTPRALQAICLKAMARNKTHRYESAVEVREDVQRFIAGEAVRAHRESAAARAWRWVKRHRRQLSRVSAVALLVVAATSALLFYRQASAYRAREIAARDVRAVRQLIDEARFYAASNDAPAERAPYFDPNRADRAGQSALTYASQRWGSDVSRLPIADLREPLRNDLAEVCILLAQSRMQPGDAADALALLDRSDALMGRAAPHAHRLRAEIARLRNQPDVAAREQRAAEAAKVSPSANDLFLQGEAQRLESGASARAGLLSDSAARADRRTAIERAMKSYRDALRLDPAHYWSRLQLGRCYLALGRGAEAVEALDACIAVRPQAPWGYSTRGLALALLRRFDEAKQDLDRAIELDPSCLPARLNRAMTLALEGNSAAAAAELDALLATPRPPAEAAYYRGQLLLAAGDPAGAISVLDRAGAEADQFPLSHVLRAKANLLLGQNDAALREVDAMVAAGGSTSDSAAAASPPGAQRGHVLRLLAAQLPANRQKPALQLAEQELMLATHARGASAAAFADLGAVLQLQGRSQAALDAFARAIEMAPNDPQPRINRGWVLDALDRPAEAEADFAAALKLSPRDPESLAGLGYALARRGRGAEAQERASLALLWSENDYRILHNVACIYGALSATEPARQHQYEDMAIALLERAMEFSRSSWSALSEVDLIAAETAAFPPALRQRAEFKQLLSMSASASSPAAPRTAAAGETAVHPERRE